MSVSYKKLFKLLIDNNLKKTEFASKVGISQNTMAKFSKGEYVSMEVMVKICQYFECKIDDILDMIPEEDNSQKD